MLLYYITDRTQFTGDQRARLISTIASAAKAGIDYIQLREKDLPARDLESLARAALKAVRDNSTTTRLLINSRTDVAIAAGADGVHLRSGLNDITASDARAIFSKVGIHKPVIASSCHDLQGVALAESHGADFAVFGPVFDKDNSSTPSGWKALREICGRPHAADPPMPVIALGGITLRNASECWQAGAAGIAGIRLFQTGEVATTISELRNIQR